MLVSLLAAVLLANLSSLHADPPGPPKYPALPSETPATFEPVTGSFDYVKRDEMIPMRDGVKLHTVILIPRRASAAPILLTRTPYDASVLTSHAPSAHLGPVLQGYDNATDVIVEGGYIRVVQDVRGKYGSEGDYVMNRPLRGPQNPTPVDHATDTYDTIDWLVKNLPESNGKVGILGISYDGFLPLMALVHPHPALKVAVPMNPMVDGWMGDDWFHHGAFRQNNLDYFTFQSTEKGAGRPIVRQGYDDYENFLRAGSTGDFARAAGLDQLPVWKKISEHPAYDSFWKEQALDRRMAAEPLTVPTMWIQGLWDQEDMWGAIHCYLAVEPKDTSNTMNYLVMGPWRHSGVNYEGYSLGPLRWEGDTALQFRRDVLKPFFDQHLKDGAGRAETPPVFIYNTGENHWDRLTRWPLACETGCEAVSKPLYLAPGWGLSFSPPVTSQAGKTDYDEYVSDPAKPVPYLPRPVSFHNDELWRRWLLVDQRTMATGRPDVLTYMTPPLTAPVRISGAPLVNLVASTTGTDSDWIVKLIDVYPDEVPGQPEMGGYQLGVAMDIFRGRYRESFETPKAIEPGKPLSYRFTLPTANHVFRSGHRIMVQVQSSWFPLYDRNPQTFVPNIFFARPEDYQRATERVYHAPGAASYISLPVVSAR